MLKEIANRYTLISLIGQGGMADVYKALDTILNRIVAVKVLRAKVSDDPMILVRFQREASAASKLSHPNIIDIYDVGEYKGTHYIVMEFVRGRTLKELIAQRGAMAPEEAISIMRQLSAAVAHAHAHHIIHRDIKPQNVLIKDDGTVKITDFGIAVANDSVALTYHNTIMGSAHYLSPETAQGKEPNPAIDIYALGIVFYEMLTGDVPFKGKTPTEIALKHLRQPLPYPRSFNPNIPQSVENIVLKAAAKDPAERYENAASLVYDLDHCLDPEYKNIRRIEPKVKSLDMEPEPEKPDRTRRVLTILVAAAAVLALAIALLWASLHFGLLRIAGVAGWQSMPEVEDLTQEEASSILSDAGFDSIVIERAVSDSVPAGSVISQSVKGGSTVKQDEEIVLTVSKGPSFLVQDYTGRYVSAVQSELESQNLDISLEIEYKGSPDTNPGIILEQSGLNAGDRIDPDDSYTMHLVVSTYPSIQLDSSLIGMDVDEAKEWLNAQGIAVITKQTSSSGTKVLSMDPAPGTEYTQEGTDSVVTLYY